MPQSAQAQTASRTPPIMLDDRLLDLVPGAVYVCNTDGVVVRYNKRAGELWGRYPEQGDPKELWCGSHRLYRANGDLMPHAETPMVDSVRNGTSFRNLEVQVEQPSGARIWIMVNIDALRDDSGEIIGVINCFQDITDRKMADDRQKHLVNELNHRVKNVLATVQSIAAQTFRLGGSEDAPKTFESRLIALSRAHDILTREQWKGADLHDLITYVVAPMCGQAGERFSVSGPNVHLSPKMTQSFAIALHELCTNAAKYGALFNEEGKVEISWTAEGQDSDRRLKLLWVEKAGPPVAEPSRRGFGSRILERSLPREHNASVKLDFRQSGLCCEIEASLT